ncbi:Transient receptor potential cation channel trpm [Bienertia sinuspersici]
MMGRTLSGAIATEEILAKDISVTDNAIDGQLIVADAGATGSIPEALEGDQTNKKQNDDDLPSENARIPNVAIPEYIRQNTPEKVKEYIDLVEEEIDVDDSHLQSFIYDIEKSIENYSTTDEDIKKEFGEEVGKNVMEDVGSIKMEEVSVHNEEKEIADHKNDDSFVCETEVNKEGKAESSETIDSYNDLPVENLLLDIVNPANPNIHVCMTKTDFLSLAPKTWLTGASIDACSYLFNRREEEKPGTPRRFWFNILPFNYINWLIDERIKKEKIESIIAEKEIDLEKAKDNPCYDTMKAEWTIPFTWRSNQNDFDCGVYCIKAMKWYDGWNEKKHPIATLSTAYTKNLSRCHLAVALVSYKDNRRKQEVFKDCALWSARKPFLIQQQKKRKDKEKHLEDIRVKRVEKVFLEDEKIKKERKGMSKRLMIF